MPTQIKTELRESVDAYHKELRSVIEKPGKWMSNKSIKKYLRQRGTENIPEEFVDYYVSLQKVLFLGEKVGLDQEFSLLEAKNLAKMLYRDPIRTKCYSETLKSRLSSTLTEVEPISIIELEQRYQYSVEKARRGLRGLGRAPISFSRWLIKIKDERILDPFGQ